MSIQTGSGSFYPPDKSILQKQLEPVRTVPVASVKMAGGFAPIKERDLVDLNRYYNLEVNGSRIYSNAQITPPAGTDATTYVFNQLEVKLDSTTLALRAASLMQQCTSLDVLTAIMVQKGVATPAKEEARQGHFDATHFFVETKRFIKLDTTTAKFSLVIESLVRMNNRDDVDQVSFIKIKINIEGPLEGLESRSAEKMLIKAAYTAEKPSEAAALQSDYSGTRAGFFNSTSYLTA